MNELHAWALRWGIPPGAVAELSLLFWSHVKPDPEGVSESAIQASLRIEAPRLGNSLWRNNNGALPDETGRIVRYGLANDSKKLNEVWKSSDLIGITPVTWAGRTFGVFTAVEVKPAGWTSPKNDRERAQANFHTSVEALGGIALFAQSIDDYRKRIAQ